MFGVGLQLASFAAVLVIQAQTVAQYTEKIPPAPSQSTIACRSNTWESANLTHVSGYRVNKKLAPIVKNLLKDSTKDNVALAITSAYRNCSEQTQLRTLACGSGSYNLLQKPIALCTPPTEPAGRSLHNEGLALDLACQGYGDFSVSPCYTWMKKHSTHYFMHEHALEAWHWSTTGH